MPLPSPQPANSALFSGLRELVQETSANSTSDNSARSSGPFERSVALNFDRSGESKQNREIPSAHRLFPSPKSFCRIQRSLSSILSAKSRVYSSTFFGKKSLYAEEFDFKKDPIHPEDRRKIRFGLKSAVDFVIQLDVENLKSCFNEPDTGVAEFREFRENTRASHVAPDSFFAMMDRANPVKSTLIQEIINRIVLI